MPRTPATEVLILKTGDTYPEIAARFGDFDRWFSPYLTDQGLAPVIKNAHRGERLPELETVKAVLITGSPAMVSHRESWSESTAAWLRRYVLGGGMALGVCYGHQLLAHALGGKAGDHPQGKEIGTLTVRLNSSGKADPLLGSLPSSFPAHLTHRQSVLALPSSAIRLASSDHDPNQAFRFGECCWGVQFHPEFTPGIMQAYLERHRSQLRDTGKDSKTSHEDNQADAPEAAKLLEAFARMIVSQP